MQHVGRRIPESIFRLIGCMQDAYVRNINWIDWKASTAVDVCTADRLEQQMLQRRSETWSRWIRKVLLHVHHAEGRWWWVIGRPDCLSWRTKDGERSRIRGGLGKEKYSLLTSVIGMSRPPPTLSSPCCELWSTPALSEQYSAHNEPPQGRRRTGLRT